MKTAIPVENGDVLASVRGFSPAAERNAGARSVPWKTGRGAHPRLVTDPARMAQGQPLAPVMPINGAAPSPP
jgi:hypothetical protein